MFKLYWFNILKLKETPENKAKIKMLEARKKKKKAKGKRKKRGAQMKHKRFQEALVALSSVYIWLLVCANV